MTLRADAPDPRTLEIRAHWQASLDLLAETGGVPVVLVAQLRDDAFESVLVNQGGEGRVAVGIRWGRGEGSYHDAVLRGGSPVHVHNALQDSRWLKAVATTGGLTSFIGYPLRWPDGTLYGTLCALDTVPNAFDGLFCRHIEQAVRAMEAELAALHENARLRREIGARQVTENALRLSEALHDEAQRIAGLGHWHHDLQTDHLMWSAQMYRLYGIEQSRFIPDYETFLGMVHPDDRAALDGKFRRAIADRQEFSHEYRLLRADGHIRWLRANAVTRYAGDGTPLMSMGTTQDITGQKEAALERELLASIIRHSRELVNVADPQGRMIFLNSAAEELVGIPATEAHRHSVLDVIPDHLREFAEQTVLPTLLTTGHWEGDLQYRNLRTGEVRDYFARCFAIRDTETGSVSCIANVSLDISERLHAQRQQRELERQLLQAEKLESLGLMAGGIAHDFNNLLQAMLGNLALASGDLPAQHPAQAAIERSTLTARRAADLSRQLLTFAGHDDKNREPADAVAAVLESLDMLRSVLDKRISITVAAPNHPLIVNAVPGQLQQVIVNLVTNAADAMSERPGALIVACRERNAGLTVRDAGDIGGPLPPGRYVELEVQDEGCGMGPDTIARLFDPFFTTKPHGRGLGMPAVLGIVRSAGGHFNVASTPGVGTRIRICWPLSEHELRPVATEAPVEPSQPLAGMDILVVDDEDTLRLVAAELLRRQGARVTEAAGGSQAIALVEKAGTPIAAVILDITMPGMDGGETFRRLRALRPDLPVLFSSGYDAPDALARVGMTARTAFIGKPWQPSELFRTLVRLLDTDPASAQT